MDGWFTTPAPRPSRPFFRRCSWRRFCSGASTSFTNFGLRIDQFSFRPASETLHSHLRKADGPTRAEAKSGSVDFRSCGPTSDEAAVAANSLSATGPFRPALTTARTIAHDTGHTRQTKRSDHRQLSISEQRITTVRVWPSVGTFRRCWLECGWNPTCDKPLRR